MAELHVSKKTIGKLLSDMQGRKFIIPDFQRPYKWHKEKCETLWTDIVNFFENDAPENDYFLGTIVTAENADKNPEVIDGQQRLTSFFLLLRAFYKKLEVMKEDDEVLGLKMQVGPCLWDVHSISKRVSDFSKIHIYSEVATDDDNDTFHHILQTGNAEKENYDNYSINYKFFLTACDDYARTKPTKWYDLCVAILNRCIILPIECNTQETALTIFSTLNDRGLPLADSDIFKAQIYKFYKSKDERKAFTETWKALTETCKSGYFTIDDIFRYYSHVLRARAGDKTKEIGLRKFYAGNGDYQRIKQPGIMDDITVLANFWYYVNTGNDPEPEEGYIISVDARKYLHCLSHYANEYWRFATSVFFLRNKTSPAFDNDFKDFLITLTAFLFAKFIDAPTVNAIKDDIYNACITLENGQAFDRTYKLDEVRFREKIDEQASSRLMRPLLLLDAYLNPNQKKLIPSGFDIEHIFPKKWQEANYNGWAEIEAMSHLDRFGNKIVFEKKLNTQAGNGYFGRKKEKYKTSEIEVVKELSAYPKNDWMKEDIEKRETEFKDRLMEFFKRHLNTV
jgi:Protein of unknown function DUF262/Protein of unknown function (DUF1524)